MEAIIFVVLGTIAGVFLGRLVIRPILEKKIDTKKGNKNKKNKRK